MDAIKHQDFDGAIKNFTEAIQASPKYSDYYYQRGLAYYVEKNYQNAISDLNQAVAIGGHAEAYLARGDAYYASGDFNGAVSAYSEGIQEFPADYAIYEHRSFAYKRLGEKQEAQSDFKKAKELKKNQ
jgi:tetratricopeptide (TPR) repeat protein